MFSSCCRCAKYMQKHRAVRPFEIQWEPKWNSNRPSGVKMPPLFIVIRSPRCAHETKCSEDPLETPRTFQAQFGRLFSNSWHPIIVARFSYYPFFGSMLYTGPQIGGNGRKASTLENKESQAKPASVGANWMKAQWPHQWHQQFFASE